MRFERSSSRALAWAGAAALAACAGPSTHHVVAPDALGPYSGAVDTGEFVFVSGKVGRQRSTFAAEAASCLDAVSAELTGLGLGLADVVSATVYLTDIGDYQTFNEVYLEIVPAPWPARACVAVAALPGGARVEVQVIARR